MTADPYMGHGLTDLSGTPIKCGASVKFLGKVEKIHRKKWDDPDDGPVMRLAVGGGYWLTPRTAAMCHVIDPSNSPDRPSEGSGASGGSGTQPPADHAR